MRVRLVGGVPQMIVEDHRYKSVPVNQPVNQHIASALAYSTDASRVIYGAKVVERRCVLLIYLSVILALLATA